MPTARSIASRGACLALAALLVLCVVGAFLGADDAGAMFTSIPLGVVWGALAVGLAACLFALPRILRSPGLLAMHGGAVLVLLGGLLGSAPAHQLARDRLGGRRIRLGYMRLTEGMQASAVKDAAGRPIGSLPFTIRLDRFTVQRRGRWELYVRAPVHREGDDHLSPVLSRLDWRVGQPTRVRETDAVVTVLEYLDRARAVYDDGAGNVLAIAPPGEAPIRLPATADAAVRLQGSGISVRILRVYSHLAVEPGDGRPQFVEGRGDPPDNPAVQVEVTDSQGTVSVHHILARPAGHPLATPPVTMHLLPAEPTGAVADPGSDRPAMKVRVVWDGRTTARWLAPTDVEPDHTSVLVVPKALAALGPEGPARSALLRLRFGRPRTGPIEDFQSDVAILEEGRVAARQTVEVNHPLRYGGYHVYQYGWDDHREQFTDLLIRSDAGLPLVYAGFALLGAGVLGWAWLGPLAARIRRRLRPGG